MEHVVIGFVDESSGEWEDYETNITCKKRQHKSPLVRKTVQVTFFGCCEVLASVSSLPQSVQGVGMLEDDPVWYLDSSSETGTD